MGEGDQQKAFFTRLKRMRRVSRYCKQLAWMQFRSGFAFGEQHVPLKAMNTDGSWCAMFRNFFAGFQMQQEATQAVLAQQCRGTRERGGVGEKRLQIGLIHDLMGAAYAAFCNGRRLVV